jgi:ribosomal protein S6
LKRYEAMFLFDNTATQQWSDIEAEVRRLCDRIQADLEVCVKFDERKLAFEIKGRKRGTYVLTYLQADPERIVDLERDAQLSESILRALVLRADQLSEERIAELKAWPAEQPLQPISGEGRRGEGGPPKPRGERAPARRPDERKAEPAATTTGETTTEATTEASAEAEAGAKTKAEAETEAETEAEPQPAPETKAADSPASDTSETKSTSE